MGEHLTFDPGSQPCAWPGFYTCLTLLGFGTKCWTWILYSRLSFSNPYISLFLNLEQYINKLTTPLLNESEWMSKPQCVCFLTNVICNTEVLILIYNNSDEQNRTGSTCITSFLALIRCHYKSVLFLSQTNLHSRIVHFKACMAFFLRLLCLHSHSLGAFIPLCRSLKSLRTRFMTTDKFQI